MSSQVVTPITPAQQAGSPPNGANALVKYGSRSPTKLAEKLKFERPTDFELKVALAFELLSLTLGVSTLFILTTYAALQYLGPGAVFFVLQLHTMTFPLFAMIMITDMLIEYAFRAWTYYRLLDEGVLIDFSNEETWQSFLRSSWIAWYIMGSTILLCISVGWYLQWGAVFSVLTLSGGLIAKIYSIRELEKNLVSVNKFLENSPVNSAQFLLDIAKKQHVVSEDEVRLAFLTTKLSHAKVDYELAIKRRALQFKAEDVDARDAQRNALYDRGIAISFAKLAAELKERPRAKDLSEALAKLSAEAAQLGFMFKKSMRLNKSRWATAMPHVFADKMDKEFCQKVMWYVRGAALAAVVCVEIYGIYALSTGRAACATGSV